MPDPDFSHATVAIVGTGLLGASLGLALKERAGVERVIGVSRSESGLQAAAERGAIDDAAASLIDAARACDVLVLCTPVRTIGPLMREAGPALSDTAIVTDVGSTKSRVVADVCDAWPGARRFVGAHPIAGAEKKGAAHARADLYDHATVILTPHPEADEVAVAAIRALWEAVGGRVCEMSPEAHDALLARTSHIPHLLAVVLADLVSPLSPEERSVIGPGFLDTTRVAAGDPEMWRDISLTNATELLKLWPELQTHLDELRGLLEAEDAVGLERYFTRVRDLRASLGPNHGRATE